MEYNGLQLARLNYKEAYDIAESGSLDVILVDLKHPRHSIFMCKLTQYKGKLMLGNNLYRNTPCTRFNRVVIEDGDYDIYSISLK